MKGAHEMEMGQPMTASMAPRPPATPPSYRRRRSSTAKSVNSVHSPPPPSPSPHPPSPEVISSLISCLAAISTPDEQPSRPGSKSSKSPLSAPSLRTASKSTPIDSRVDLQENLESAPPQPGLGVDFRAYKRLGDVNKNSYLVADTAFAPTVKLSKSPAASSRISDKTKESNQSRNIPLDEDGSVSRHDGVQSTDSSPAGIATSRDTNITNLLRKKSREAFIYSKKGSSRSSRSTGDTLSPLSVNLRHHSSSSDLKEEAVDEGSAWHSSTTQQFPVCERRSSLNATNSKSSPTPNRMAGIWSHRFIPSRQSSLQHKNGKKSSMKNVEEDKDDQDADNDLDQDDTTVKRIRELQKKKEKREREQRREERRETKKSRSSLPPPLAPERAAHRSSRHSMGDIASRGPSRPILTSTESAPPSALGSYSRRRLSIGLSPPSPGILASPKTDSPSFDPRPAHTGRPMTPRTLRRVFGESQRSPTAASFGDRPESTNSFDLAIEAYVTSQRLTQKIRHPHSGRVVAFSEVGDPNGFPVICCVGMGMTRYAMAFYDELAASLRLRLITIDRPGVGESETCSDGTGTPMNWPDDVTLVSNALSLTRFSLLAHSAGAVYALATALRLPQKIRGRIQLLAPWIPPSQIAAIGSQNDAFPSSSIPYTQKLLRVLPTSLLRAANSTLMSSTPSSKMNKSPRWAKRKSLLGELPRPSSSGNGISGSQSFMHGELNQLNLPASDPTPGNSIDTMSMRASPSPVDENYLRARQLAYDTQLTQRIWELAQRNANPAVDLIICLEREQAIGFCYVDVTRACVVRHGARDTRVPVDNVRWLGKKMRRCEVRVLEGEGHSLMANAGVIGEVLMEVAREWEDWARITREGRGKRLTAGAAGLI